MSIASILSVISALVIVGVIFTIVINVNHIIKQIENSLEINIYLEDDITQLQKDNIYNTLLLNENVADITYQSKEAALEDFKESLGTDNDYLLSGYTIENSPIPASYIVKISDADKIHDVYLEAKDLSGVKEAVYGEQTVEKLLAFTKFTNIVSWVIFGILSLIAVFIIFNTIKLTVFSRKNEIIIMKYVGATNWYIRIPFIIEGSLLGISGAVISVMIIRSLYFFMYGILQSSLTSLPLGTSLAAPSGVISQIFVYFLFYGIFLGTLGSSFSIKKFLHV
jgi:cell division transport system permease protein